MIKDESNIKTANKRLRILRKEAGMTQEELSKKLDVKRVTINAYEVGRNNISQDKIKMLAEIFHVSTDYLIGKTDIREPLCKNDVDVSVQIDSLVKDIINSTDNLTFDGNSLDDSTKSILIQSLKNSVELVRSLNSNKSNK